MNATPFHAAIRDRPDDDTPRLVYADWLDEHGDSDRAEFIRVQCALAAAHPDDPRRDDLEDREADLLAEHEYAWLGDAGQHVLDWRFRRGFIEEIGGSAAVTMLAWDRLRQTHPVRAVTWNYLENADPRRLLEAGSFAGLTGLTILPAMSDAWLQSLTSWRNLNQLRSLRIQTTPRRPARESAIVDGILPQMVGGALTRLSLAGLSGTPNIVERLIAIGIAPQLRSLEFGHSALPATALARLLVHPAYTDLRRLTIPSFGLAHPDDIAQWEPFPKRNLVSLDLGPNALGARQLAILRESPMLGGLRQFSWTNSPAIVPIEEFVGILEAMPQLESLTFGRSTPTPMEAIAEHLPRQLRSLELRNCEATIASWEQLETRLDGARLRAFRIIGARLDPVVSQQIWRSPACVHVRSLRGGWGSFDSDSHFDREGAAAGPRRLREWHMPLDANPEWQMPLDTNPEKQQRDLADWLGSPAAARIQSLALTCPWNFCPDLRLFARMDEMTALRRIELAFGDFSTDEIVELIHLPLFRQVHHSDLSSDDGEAILQALLARPGLPHLRHMVVDGMISDETSTRMRERFGPDVLTSYRIDLSTADEYYP